MCGRYASSATQQDLVSLFDIERFDPAEALAPDFNVAPTKQVYAVLDRPAEPGGEPVRQLRTLKWGLVPSWAKDPSVGAKMINARSETVHEKPSFRKPFAARRCLIPADGYYEWNTPQTAPDGSKGSSRKQPYFISHQDGSPLVFAGLYEWWRDKGRPDDDPAAWLWTCTVITTDAEPELAKVHHRMPLVLDQTRWDAWLDPTLTGADEVRGLLDPPEPGLMTMRAVSTDVNNVRNNSRELLNPIPADEVLGDITLF